MSFLGEARHKAGELKTKVQGFVGEHDRQVDSAIDKVAGFVDGRTKRRYHDRVEGAAGKLKHGVDRLSGKNDSDSDGDSSA